MIKKLIELIRKGRYKAENICNENDDCQRCTIADPDGNCKIGYIVDHLIANGVTIAKWIPVTERLPEQYHSVIVWTRDMEMGEAAHDGERFRWAYDDDFANATHWMHFPQPPKGE